MVEPATQSPATGHETAERLAPEASRMALDQVTVPLAVVVEVVLDVDAVDDG